MEICKHCKMYMKPIVDRKKGEAYCEFCGYVIARLMNKEVEISDSEIMKTKSQENIREKFIKEFALTETSDLNLKDIADFWLSEIARVVGEDEKMISFDSNSGILEEYEQAGMENGRIRQRNQERARIRKAFNIK